MKSHSMQHLVWVFTVCLRKYPVYQYSERNIVLILANSADPDEMPPYAAFGLGLHCLLKYLYTVKSVLRGQSKIYKTKVLMENGSLMKVKSIGECSRSILQYF